MEIDAWQSAVINGLDRIDGNRIRGEGDRPWTRAVLRALNKVGKEFGFYTCSTGSTRTGAEDREWLWDCVWLKYAGDRQSAPLKFVPMVAECEWQGRPKIKEDFEKLLAANAPLRVFVFAGGWGAGETIAKESLSVAQEILRWVRATGITADYDVRYLLASRESIGKPVFRFFEIAKYARTPRNVTAWWLQEV